MITLTLLQRVGGRLDRDEPARGRKHGHSSSSRWDRTHCKLATFITLINHFSWSLFYHFYHNSTRYLWQYTILTSASSWQAHSLHQVHSLWPPPLPPPSSLPILPVSSCIKKTPLSTPACTILLPLTCPVLLRRLSHSILLVLYDLLPHLLCLAFLGRHCKQNTHSHSPAFISLAYSIPLLWKRDLAHVTPVRQQNRFDSAKPMFIPGKSRVGEALINGISMRLASPT